MRSVLGVDVGDTVDVGVIDGPRGTAAVAGVSESEILLEFHLDTESEIDRPFPVTILLGHPRPIVLKRILKDLTTLGAERIVVSGTDTGEKSYLQSKLWNGDAVRCYLIDGAAQAGVTCLPKVDRVPTVGDALDLLEAETQPTSDTWNLQALAMDNQPFHTHLSGVSLKRSRVVLAVGSERGWSDGERLQLRNRGFNLCTMGARILRTETAVVCATSLVLSKIGLV